jgi:hypothetical protein
MDSPESNRRKSLPPQTEALQQSFVSRPSSLAGSLTMGSFQRFLSLHSFCRTLSLLLDGSLELRKVRLIVTLYVNLERSDETF